MNFKEKYLKKDSSVYFIAEIGINHNGYLDLAKKMIDFSKDAGADAVKFQKRNIEYLVDPKLEQVEPTGYLSKDENDTPSENKAFGTWTYPDKRLEFSDDVYLELIEYAHKRSLDFIVSPWEEKTVDFLAENNAKVIKVASIDANNYQFLEYIASKQIPTIVSTGMITYDQMLITKKIFIENKCPMMFLHCTSAYPCPLEDKNLNIIKVMKKLFNEDVGFSGHGTGIEGTIGAVTLGANVIEKHVTLSRNMSGPDQNASLEFDELNKLINLSNNMIKAMGSTEKKLQESEKTLKGVLQKKFISKKPIKKGSEIKGNMIRTVVSKNPNGIDPEQYYSIINRTVKENIRRMKSSLMIT